MAVTLHGKVSRHNVPCAGRLARGAQSGNLRLCIDLSRSDG
jgi:hypothetical protein